MTTPTLSGTPSVSAAVRPLTLGVVSFLNARPLRETLDDRDDVSLLPDVPARLGERLDRGECDAALLPIVDYWPRRDRLEIVSDACIGSDGETLTVRVFSAGPPDRIEQLHVDGDSHTSVTLARLIWRELYGRTLHLRPYSGEPATAVLLIGDKVVTRRPRGFGFEVDLGAAWKHLTGLPFVFAAWYGRRGSDLQAASRMLSEARDAGVAHAREIARRMAPLHGWPIDVAEHYLCDVMKYSITPPMRSAMDRFFELADGHGLLP